LQRDERGRLRLERKNEKIVKPEAMVVITLDEIAGRLADLNEVQQKILRHMEETTPEGKDVLVFEGTVDPPGKFVDPIKNYPYHPLFRAEVINKGANTVYARVDEEKEMPIEAEESIVFEKPKAQIGGISLRLDAATTVKILGRY